MAWEWKEPLAPPLPLPESEKGFPEMRGRHWACRILAAGHQVGLRSAGQTAEHWALLRLSAHERGTQQGDKATHACWAHSDSCYFRSVSTLRQVRCQANAVLGFCPAVPSPPLLIRMTYSGTGESISVHSPATPSHKKTQTNRSLRSLPLPGGPRYHHEKVHSWLPFAKGDLKAAV